MIEVDTQFGNPGGSLVAVDDESGFVMLARVPAHIQADLARLSRVTWDEFVPSTGGVNVVRSTVVRIIGSDGTMYETKKESIVTDQWRTQTASFLQPGDWFLVDETGDATFEETLASAVVLGVVMDTTNGLGVESWVDNVRFTLVPLPAALPLMMAGLALLGGLLGRGRTA